MKIITLAALFMTVTFAVASPLESFKKVGEARLEVLFWDIYDSELYSETGEFYEGDLPLALNIRYLRNFKSSSLVDKAGEEWLKLGYSSEQTNQWLAIIDGLWPDVSKGDELLLTIDSNGVSQFFYNSQPLGKVNDTSFGKGFIAIWLDKNSSYPKLRNSLTGQI